MILESEPTVGPALGPAVVIVVAAALLRGDGRVLMQRRPPGKAHGGVWEFPGGKVEAGESLEAALARELAEELGIALDPAALVPAAFAAEPPQPGAVRRLILALYAARAWGGEPLALEGGEVQWFEPSEMAALEMPPLDVPLVARLSELVCCRAI